MAGDKEGRLLSVTYRRGLILGAVPAWDEREGRETETVLPKGLVFQVKTRSRERTGATHRDPLLNVGVLLGRRLPRLTNSRVT